MGGLFAVTAHDDVVPLVIGGLASLAPPDGDSSGIGALTERRIQRRRIDGPVSSLEALLSKAPIAAFTALGHSGRATMGLASRPNAQPHASSRVALVQVGILENHAALRLELEGDGVQFRSDTDSEVIVWLLDKELRNRVHPMTALQRVLPRLRGSFALGVICSEYEDRLYAARRGVPLAVGQSAGKACLASDIKVLARYTRESMALEDGRIAELRPSGVRVFDAALVRHKPRWNRGVRYSPTTESDDSSATSRGRHEIAEQPARVASVLGRLARDLGSRDLEHWCGPLWRADRILAIGCGDSSHIAHVGRGWFEQVAGIPVELELSWELPVRRAIFAPGTVPLVVSSSESDADALAALRYLKRRNVPAVALVHGSSKAVVQEADVVLDCARQDAGGARGEAFMPQLTALAAASIAARHLRSGVGVSDALPPALADVPRAMESALALEEPCAQLGRRISDAARVVFVGRGTGRPLAALGARRLEKLAHVRSAVLNGGELKYRSPSTIQTATPAVVLAPDGGTAREAVSDARHVLAAGGEPWLLGVTGTPRRDDLRSISAEALDPVWAPFALAIPLQLIALHAANSTEPSRELTPPVRELDHEAANRRAQR